MKYFLILVLLLAGCEPLNRPVELLTFAEKKAIVDACNASGKMATNNYCREVSHAFGREEMARLQQDRLNRSANQNYTTAAKFR